MRKVYKISAYQLVSVLLAVYCLPASLFAQQLQYVSTSPSAVSNAVFPGQTNAKVLKIKINLVGATGTASAKRFIFSISANTKSPDIQSASLYYTSGTDYSGSMLNATDTAGKIITTPSGKFVIKTNKALKPGDNFFFLTCNVNRLAAIGDTISARLDSVVVNDTLRIVTGNPTSGIGVTANVSYCPIHIQKPNSTKFALVGITEVKIDKAIDNVTADKDSLIFYNQKLTAYPQESYPLTIKCGKDQTEQLAAWVDWNNDGFFDNTNELIFRDTAIAPATAYTGTLTIPCKATYGTHRMRIISDIDTAAPVSVCSNPWSGDAEEYLIDVQPEPKPVAKFIVDTPAYVGSAITFNNKSIARGNVKYEWDFNNDGIYDTVAQTARHVFNKTGKVKVKLKVTLSRCDSTFTSYYIDSLKITYPSKKPVPDFIASNNYVGTGAIVQLTDLSTRIPNNWQWEITPSIINGQPAYNYVDNTNFNSQNPAVMFLQPGQYTVSLAAGNWTGLSNRYTRTNLITVVQSLNMCSTDTIRSNAGFLYDDGGPNAPYGRKRNCSVTIKPPCATSINITFHQLDASIYDEYDGGDRLKIFEGSDSSGKALHASAGYKHGFQNQYPDNRISLPGKITANSDAAFINWQADSNYLGDGFAIEWSSVLRSSAPPKASLSAPDSANQHLAVHFTSTSTGPELRYFWDLNGDGMNDSNDPDPSYVYTRAGVYNVRLIAANCGGVDTVYHLLHIKAPKGKPAVDFQADYTRIPTGDHITLQDLTTNQPYYWRWRLSCNNPAANPVFLSGDTTSQNPVIQFPDSGFYTIKLVSGNDSGSGQMVKTSYLEVYNHCVPSADHLSESIDISRIFMTNVDKDSLINQYIPGLVDYSVFNQKAPSLLEINGHFTLTGWRDTVFSGQDMNVKVWIDFNGDGDFGGFNENVLTINNVSTKSWTGTFFVPNSVIPGVTRMRIGVTYAGKPISPCGPNFIGSFADFNVLIAKDQTPPALNMNGLDTMVIEQGRSFKDPGATAFDHTDGDLTSKILVINPVDTANPGNYTIVYQVKDHAGNISMRTRLVRIIPDTTSPAITLAGGNKTYVEIYHPYTEEGASVKDNIDTGLSVSISGSVDTMHLGTYIITYESQDLLGNKTVVERVVTVGDTTRPQLTPNGNDTTILEVFSKYVEQGVNAIDNYTEFPSLKIQGTVNTSKLGKYLVTYKAKDSVGNIGTAYRWVFVVDTIAPKLVLRTHEIYWDVYKHPFTYPDTIYRTDNYYAPSQLAVFINTQPVTATVGNDTVYYYAIDPSHNISKADRLVIHVVDRISPTIELLGDTIVYVQQWDEFNDPYVVTGDNYDVHLKVVFGGSFTGTDIPGVYNRTYQAVDHSGNVSDMVARWIVVYPRVGLTENSQENKQLNLYPNPATNFLHLHVGNPGQGMQYVEVKDMCGRKMWQTAPVMTAKTDWNLDVSRLPSGIYFINYLSGNQQYPYKVVVTH
jgi:PKD repeat protein